MVIRGVASSSLDGLRNEGPGTAVAVRKLRKRGQSLPHIFLGRPTLVRTPRGARARATGEEQSQGSRSREVTWKVRGHGAREGPGIEGTWNRRVVWPWNPRLEVRGRDGSHTAFLHQIQTPWWEGVVVAS